MTLLAVATNPGLLNGITNDDAYLGLEWPPKEINNNYTLLDIVAKYASRNSTEV